MPTERYPTPAYDEAYRQLMQCWRHLFDVVQDGLDPAQVEPKEKLLHLCADMLEIYGIQVDRAKLQDGLARERPVGFSPTGRHVKHVRRSVPPQAA